MSKRTFGDKIKLSSYNDMFGLDDEKEKENVTVTVEEQIKDVALTELHPFKNHPFKVLEDEKMDEMVESVKEYGILVPIMARKREEGGYELISGHRRHHAAKLAGLAKVPVMIRDCSDDEATVIMVDANIQREDISISEKAKAYRMKYDALKHQGASGGNSLELMSESAGDSKSKIQRYIYLSNLTEDILGMLDAKKLGVAQGVDLAALTEEQQKIVFKVMQETGIIINMEQSARIKNAAKDGLFSEQWLVEILNYKKPAIRKVVFNQNRLDSYFEPHMSNEDIENVIVKLLDEWKAKGGNA